MLHFAAERGNERLGQCLLYQPQALAMVVLDHEGRSLSHSAAASSRFHLIYPLVHTQLDLEHRDHLERTVLHHAAMRGNISVVEHILTLGSGSLELQDINGRTPLQLARLHGSTTVAGFLKSRCFLSTALPAEHLCEKPNLGEGSSWRKWDKNREQYLDFQLGAVMFFTLVVVGVY